jgi:hypothetical protein
LFAFGSKNGEYALLEDGIGPVGGCPDRGFPTSFVGENPGVDQGCAGLKDFKDTEPVIERFKDVMGTK